MPPRKARELILDARFSQNTLVFGEPNRMPNALSTKEGRDAGALGRRNPCRSGFETTGVTRTVSDERYDNRRSPLSEEYGRFRHVGQRSNRLRNLANDDSGGPPGGHRGGQGRLPAHSNVRPDS